MKFACKTSWEGLKFHVKLVRNIHNTSDAGRSEQKMSRSWRRYQANFELIKNLGIVSHCSTDFRAVSPRRVGGIVTSKCLPPPHVDAGAMFTLCKWKNLQCKQPAQCRSSCASLCPPICSTFATPTPTLPRFSICDFHRQPLGCHSSSTWTRWNEVNLWCR